MATTTVSPNGTVLNTGFLNESASTSNPHLSIDDSVDSSDGDTTYIEGNDTKEVRLNLTNMPSDFGVATAVTIRLRAKTTGVKGDIAFITSVRLYESNQVTALTNAGTNITLTTSYATYESVRTITGATDKTSWDGALLYINSAGTNGSARITAAEVLITYTVSGGDGGSTTSKVHKMLLGDK